MENFFIGTHWHQKWEVFEGVFTPGVNSVRELCNYIQLPSDLTGKRVLDIGAWNGCFSFECERRGASEVIAYSLENPEESGFNKLQSLLNSRVSYVQGSAYSLSPEMMGSFDVILFLGVLYHLRYPLLAIDRIRTVSKGIVLIETHVYNDPLTILKKLLGLDSFFKSIPLWRQYREYELNPEDRSNWFGPNVQAVIESFESAGFEISHLTSWGDRAAFSAKIMSGRPDRLFLGSYEGLHSIDPRL